MIWFSLGCQRQPTTLWNNSRWEETQTEKLFEHEVNINRWQSSDDVWYLTPSGSSPVDYIWRSWISKTRCDEWAAARAVCEDLCACVTVCLCEKRDGGTDSEKRLHAAHVYTKTVHSNHVQKGKNSTIKDIKNRPEKPIKFLQTCNWWKSNPNEQINRAD